MKGTIRERNGRHAAMMTITDPSTGKRRQLYGGTHDTRDAAELALAKLNLEYDAGQHTAAHHSLDALLDLWLADNADRWSAGTLPATRNRLALHVRPRLGGTDVRKITSFGLNDLFKALHKRGSARVVPAGDSKAGGKPLSAKTVQRVRSDLQSAFNHAIGLGWITTNPAEGKRVKMPTDSETFEMYVPEADEVRRLLDAATQVDPDFGMYVRLAAATGARRSELAALRWSNVDLAAGSIYISHALADGGRDVGVVEKATKTRTKRTNLLDPVTAGLLGEHRQRAVQRALTARGTLEADAFVFSLRDDGSEPWRPELPTKRFRQARNIAGLDSRVRLHGLRHFMATNLLDAGIDESQVAGQLGHATGAKTTRAVYAHRKERQTNVTVARMIGALLTEEADRTVVGA